jgi:hypothetical protein
VGYFHPSIQDTTQLGTQLLIPKGVRETVVLLYWKFWMFENPIFKESSDLFPMNFVLRNFEIRKN